VRAASRILADAAAAEGRPVDLVVEGSVRNPFVRAGIERSAETVYGPRAYLWGARESADAIASFVRERTFEDYRADVMLRSAVEHACHLQFIAMATNMKRAAVLIREARGSSTEDA